jgi:NADPH:quinone reductase-like Zn-dependent oxidoreductase
VGELAKSLKTGGSVVVYALQSGQFPVMPPKEFIYSGLSLHGFWLINWIRNAPRTEIQEVYQKLGDLVANGSLSAAVEQVYPLKCFKEAFEQSLKSSRSGKILFDFSATQRTDQGTYQTAQVGREQEGKRSEIKETGGKP